MPNITMMWRLFLISLIQNFTVAIDDHGTIPLINNPQCIESGDRIEPPQHGLYLLGEFREDCIFKSVSAYGRINANMAKKTRGLLLFYVIRNEKNITKVKYMFDAKQPTRKEAYIERKVFNEAKHPVKGDFLAVYIPKKNISGFYPLEIVVNKSSSSNAYCVWNPPVTLVTWPTNLTDMKRQVKTAINNKQWSNWTDLHMKVEFNINIKCSPKNSEIPYVYIIGGVLGFIIIALFIVIVILVAAKWCHQGRKATGTDGGILLDERDADQDASFERVGYVLQKEGDKGKTVINVHYHYHKEESSNEIHQGHEYSVLTEISTPLLPPKLSPNHAALDNHEDHDYDEPYFEPSCMEEKLLSQLKSLSVPVIKEESLELLTGELLGSGAFGSVYKGYLSSGQGDSDQVMKEEVAVKTMEDGASEGDRVKFLQEAAIMGQFHHPNIIKILGVVIDQQQCQIVVDVMANGDLRKYLQTLKASNLDSELAPTLLSCSRHVANGMMYLEVKSFIHRDLAARNVLVAEDGVCKIADFGLSRGLQHEDFYLSHGGKIPVKWTAPEALHYHKYSTASDVWSYGCVLYEIWSLGEKPYCNLTNEQAIGKLLAGFRLFPPPGCPRDVYHIMIQCWNPEPLKRPSFMDITTLLQKPDFQVLKWSAEEVKSYSEAARTLGAPLDAGCQLHKDLQNSYVTAD